MKTTYTDIQALIDAHALSAMQILVVTLCFLVATLDGLDVGVIGSLAPSIARDWALAPAQLSHVFGAGLFGLMLGAFSFGPLADRFGRKSILMLTVAGFGAASFASGFASGVGWLAVLRFLTGFFLGGALPNALTLTSEYAPTRFRYLMVTAIPCGFTIGGALGGLVVAQMVTQPSEWRHVLILGGVLPLVLLPVLYAALPESARYLVLRGGGHAQVQRILGRIAPGADLSGMSLQISAPAAANSQTPGGLLGREFRLGTLLLWATFFMGLLLYYLLISWLPVVIATSGTELRDAILLSAMFPVGSTVGAVMLGALMDRLDPYWVLAIAFVAGGVAVGLIGHVYMVRWALGLTIFCAGFGNGGSIVGANALSSAFYPVGMRGTGVSWALGVGRAGSIVGSMIGSVLIALHLGMPSLFALIATPALLAAFSIFAMGRARARAPTVERQVPAALSPR